MLSPPAPRPLPAATFPRGPTCVQVGIPSPFSRSRGPFHDHERDRSRHNDLSEDVGYQKIRWDLIRRNFHATVFAHPIGPPPRSMPF